jgi:hypothetical protein
MAPALMEIDMPTEADGKEVFDFMHHIDLLAMQSALDDLTALSLLFEQEEGQHVVNLEGQIEGQDVMVILHLSPFEDAEVIGMIQRAFTDDGQPTIRIVPKGGQDEEL